MRMIYIAIIYCLLLKASICLSQELNFEITVDRARVSLGGSIQLNLTFSGIQHISAPEFPEIDGFESRYIGPSTRMSIVNGRVSSSITHVYTLIPLKTGTFQIGPFTVMYKGRKYASNAVRVEVVERDGQAKRDKAEIHFKNRIFVNMELQKNRIYLNEIIPLVIKLYVNRLTVRDIQYPEVPHEGFSGIDFGKPRQYQEVLNGIMYDVIEFKTDIFATRYGNLTIGPAHLKCNLVIKRHRRRPSSIFDDFFNDDFFDDFFGRYETYPVDLESRAISIRVLPLPEEGRPKDFTGAVGNFHFSAEAEPTEVKVGDPITLKMVIEGKGNFNTVTCPKIASEDGFKVYKPEIKQEGNKKRFEQILMPTTDSVTEIPSVSFSFFDPERGVYQTVVRDPIPIKVAKLEKEKELKVVESPQVIRKYFKEEKLGRDIIYIKESLGRLKERDAWLYKNRVFLLLQFIPVIFLSLMAVLHKRSERLRTDIQYARSLSASKMAKKSVREAAQFLKRGDAQEFYGFVFKTMREYLGDKFHIPRGGITAEVIEEVLKQKRIDEDILNKLKRIFRDCDTARYAPSEFGRKEMEDCFKDMEDIITYLEKRRL